MSAASGFLPIREAPAPLHTTLVWGPTFIMEGNATFQLEGSEKKAFIYFAVMFRLTEF